MINSPCSEEIAARVSLRTCAFTCKVTAVSYLELHMRSKTSASEILVGEAVQMSHLEWNRIKQRWKQGCQIGVYAAQLGWFLLSLGRLLPLDGCAVFGLVLGFWVFCEILSQKVIKMMENAHIALFISKTNFFKNRTYRKEQIKLMRSNRI